MLFNFSKRIYSFESSSLNNLVSLDFMSELSNDVVLSLLLGKVKEGSIYDRFLYPESLSFSETEMKSTELIFSIASSIE